MYTCIIIITRNYIRLDAPFSLHIYIEYLIKVTVTNQLPIIISTKYICVAINYIMSIYIKESAPKINPQSHPFNQPGGLLKKTTSLKLKAIWMTGTKVRTLT